MFGTSCPGSWRCCRGARLAWGLHGHAATSPSPPPAARPAPELAQPREGGWCWQLALCSLPSIRQGRFLLFLSPSWQWDCSWVFILPPLCQCIPCASMCSAEPQSNPSPQIPQPMAKAPSPASPCEGRFAFSPDKVPPSVLFLVPTARVVAQAVPHSPVCQPSFLRDQKAKLGFCWRSVGWEEGALTQQCPSLCWQCKVTSAMALPVCRGKCWPRAQSSCVATLKHLCCPSHGQGVLNTQEVSREPWAHDSLCTV